MLCPSNEEEKEKSEAANLCFVTGGQVTFLPGNTTLSNNTLCTGVLQCAVGFQSMLTIVYSRIQKSANNVLLLIHRWHSPPMC